MIKTGNRNFWITQIIGWGIFAGSNLIVQIIGGFPLDLLLTNSLIPFSVGFLTTTIYRYLIKDVDWKYWKFSKLLLLLIGSSSVLTIAFMAIIYSILFLFIDVEFNLAKFLSNFVIFGLIMSLWNFIYFFIHYFNSWHNSEIDKWKLAAEIKDSQLGNLKAQINPHFIFNAINNIRSLILEDKEKAREMLLNFSDLFRYSLKHNENATVELEEEVEIVQQYLELLSIQFEDKLAYKINLENDLLKETVPPMMLQLLVENAIKHGISQFTDGGSIVIDIHKKEDFLLLNVRNTGKLNNTVKLGEKLGVGLENIKKRLDLIYTGKAKFDLTEKNNFVTASIKIPLI